MHHGGGAVVIWRPPLGDLRAWSTVRAPHPHHRHHHHRHHRHHHHRRCRYHPRTLFPPMPATPCTGIRLERRGERRRACARDADDAPSFNHVDARTHVNSCLALCVTRRRLFWVGRCLACRGHLSLGLTLPFRCTTSSITSLPGAAYQRRVCARATCTTSCCGAGSLTQTSGRRLAPSFPTCSRLQHDSKALRRRKTDPQVCRGHARWGYFIWKQTT